MCTRVLFFYNVCGTVPCLSKQTIWRKGKNIDTNSTGIVPNRSCLFARDHCFELFQSLYLFLLVCVSKLFFPFLKLQKCSKEDANIHTVSLINLLLSSYHLWSPLDVIHRPNLIQALLLAAYWSKLSYFCRKPPANLADVQYSQIVMEQPKGRSASVRITD